MEYRMWIYLLIMILYALSHDRELMDMISTTYGEVFTFISIMTVKEM